jgi:hypothetical protein
MIAVALMLTAPAIALKRLAQYSNSINAKIAAPERSAPNM